ncbi:MAG: class I SAM-dependent methyltransferase family protein [archaeon]|nr:class I SAM-dependent methyltransferase family protein [archaeon]
MATKSGEGISVEKRFAQKLHAFLLKEGILSKTLRPLGKGERIVFPVEKIPQKTSAGLAKNFPGSKIVRENFNARDGAPKSLREALKGRLLEKEIALVQTSYDTLGDVAIIEVPDALKGKSKLIGEALLATKNSIDSVYEKAGPHKGVFREEPVKFVAGMRKKFATYKEHGCTFQISLGKVFFSPRLSTERLRISKKIMPGEKVAALFAGVGPFPIVFARNSKMQNAVAIELNPKAVEDMRQNIVRNKVQGKVEPVQGDVKLLAKKYAGEFDRAVLPLPKGGEDFLVDTIKYIRPEGGVVHFYQFSDRASPFKKPLEQVAGACKIAGRKFRVLVKKKVREFSPSTVQVVIDFKVLAAPAIEQSGFFLEKKN